MKVMVIVKASKDSESGALPSGELLSQMQKFNEELISAGVMQAGEGLKASSAGARVHFDGAARTVTRGPFPGTGDLVAGFWIWQVKDLQDAIDWVKRCPNPQNEPTDVEIRPVFEPDDFAASDPTGEIRAAERDLRSRRADA
jgi:PhnB protein